MHSFLSFPFWLSSTRLLNGKLYLELLGRMVYFLTFVQTAGTPLSGGLAWSTRFTITDTTGNTGTLAPTGASGANPGGNGTIVTGVVTVPATTPTGGASTPSGSSSAPTGTGAAAKPNGASSVSITAMSAAAAAVVGAVSAMIL
ncbi:hypothetical protein BGZ99_010134 [Dissophora globulifera]|uniref:Uncharacterized protein n=1 Tax=Dissophora globulifera TaxID=979702 RepID=A0A9P6R7K2_9FUNG|nr:hypothetical protein BGZ99_010134 [Dissophora globulifera]